MTPACRIEVDGIDITTNLIPAGFGSPLAGGGVAIPNGFGGDCPLLSITFTDNEGGKSDSVTFDIDNRERHRAPKKGSTVKLWLGYVGDLHYCGSFKTTSWTKSGRPLKMSITAESVDMTKGIKGPKSRSYHKKKVKEIVEQVSKKHGLKAQVSPGVADMEIGHIDQSSESDLNFLTRLAKRVGAKFKIADGNVLFRVPGEMPGGGAVPGVVFREVGITDWSASGAERGSYNSVSAAWLNPKTGEREWENEGEGEADGKPRYRDRKLYKTQEEARRAAKSQLADQKRGKVTVTINMPGDLSIFAGMKSTVALDDEDVDGAYIVKTGTHTLDDSGLKSSFSNESEGSEDDDKKSEKK